VKHNVPALDTFLTKTLDKHKQRWFFPFRVIVNAGSMTFNQKTNSPIEGCNHTIKYKSSKTVDGNMTMLESLQTQNAQQETRMMAFLKKKNAGSREFSTLGTEISHSYSAGNNG